MQCREECERDEHDRDDERGRYPGDRGRTMDGDCYRQAYPPRGDSGPGWSRERRDPEEWMRFGGVDRLAGPSSGDQGVGDWPRDPRRREDWPLGRPDERRVGGRAESSNFGREDFGGYASEDGGFAGETPKDDRRSGEHTHREVNGRSIDYPEP